jgi:hypothetical protein
LLIENDDSRDNAPTHSSPHDATVNHNLSFFGSEAAVRLKQKLLHIQTELCWLHIVEHFHPSDITNDELANPLSLISLIYERYGFVALQQMSGVVNHNVNQIANLHHVSITAIRKDLVYRWLQKQFPEASDHIDALSSSSPSIPETWRALGSIKNEQEDMLIDQMVYLCLDEPIETTCRTLWAYASNPHPRSNVTYRAKHRALRILVKLVAALDISVDVALKNAATHPQVMDMMQVDS